MLLCFGSARVYVMVSWEVTVAVLASLGFVL